MNRKKKENIITEPLKPGKLWDYETFQKPWNLWINQKTYEAMTST